MSGGRDALVVSGLVSGYENRIVLNQVDVRIGEGEIVAIVGHNGAGKSTLLKAIFGVLPRWGGEILLMGSPASAFIPRDWSERRVVYLPQGGTVFPDLSVRENIDIHARALQLGGYDRLVDEAVSKFPLLQPLLKRRAGTLSGGERQAVAIARALAISPRLALLDEPTLGLSPLLASAMLSHVQKDCRASGSSFVIVEQKVREVLRIAERAYVLRNGLVAYSGDARLLATEEALRLNYL